MLGRRIAAALIDILLLGCLSFAVGALPGGGEVKSEDGISVTLSGLGILIFLVVVLAYHFVFEVTIGKSVGKLLLGLRVLGENGEPPQPSAIAVRTVLRIVDALPFFYIVGFITLLASKPRGRRLGDVAAKTVVVRG